MSKETEKLDYFKKIYNTDLIKMYHRFDRHYSGNYNLTIYCTVVYKNITLSLPAINYIEEDGVSQEQWIELESNLNKEFETMRRIISNNFELI
jgi:hypothetical protein